jgi:hypothetical protein
MSYKQVYKIEAKNLPGIIKITEGSVGSETNPKTLPKPGVISKPYFVKHYNTPQI